MRRHKWKSKEIQRAEEFISQTRQLFQDWDKIHDTNNCPHCHGTGKAPGDGATECGFCE